MNFRCNVNEVTESVQRMKIRDGNSGSVNKVKSGSVRKKKSSKKSRSCQDPIRAAERRYRQGRRERVDDNVGVSDVGGSSSVIRVSSPREHSLAGNQRFGVFVKIKI